MRVLLASSVLVTALLVLWSLDQPVQAQPQPEDLARKAKAFFTTHCYRCHGQNGSNEGNMNFVTELKQLVEKKKVVPKEPAKSRVFKRISADFSGDMPADDLTKPKPEEIALIKQWIEAGAPEAPAEQLPPRPFFSLSQEIQAIDTFLTTKIDHRKWPTYRFFSLRNLHNMPQEKVKDSDLLLYQAALAKLLNSLSWRNKIVVPEKVDPAGIVLAVNIEDLDWADPKGKNLWREVLKVYPYALTHFRYPEDPTVNNGWKTITNKTDAVVPVVRVDWFIAAASRPPLYHLLAQLPDDLAGLQKRIPVGAGEYLDLDKDIRDGRVARAGFNGSGVSERNNRMIERHETSYGAFWISYDFKVSAGKGNLFVFPLGPSFKGNEFEKHAFVHAGGEVIFNLPNGMQGYLLVDGKGKRIDEGPVDIVSDGKKVSGTPAVVNGVSCMSCHQHGMIRKDDQIRESHVLGGKAKERINDIYLKHEAMNERFAQDEKRFLDSLTAAVRPFLLTGPNAGKSVTDFGEPISPIARWYIANELTLADAARELGLEKAEILAGVVQANEELQAQGLLPLARGQTIKREVWESLEFLYSPYQKAAKQLKMGEPAAVR
jgi:serine/threonine-protein kinase